MPHGAPHPPGGLHPTGGVAQGGVSKISCSGSRFSMCTVKSALRSGGFKIGGGLSNAARMRTTDTSVEDEASCGADVGCCAHEGEAMRIADVSNTFRRIWIGRCAGAGSLYSSVVICHENTKRRENPVI